jgi:hypothetical protein
MLHAIKTWAGVDSEWRGAYLASYPQESIEPIIAVAAHVQRGRQGSGRERGLRVACALRYITYVHLFQAAKGASRELGT